MITDVEVWQFDEALSTATMRERLNLDEDTHPHLSASNTPGCSLLVRAPVPVGVDVESLRFHPYLDRLARRTMNDVEHGEWFLTADRSIAFTQHWTMVEAYLKTTGEGIRGGLLRRPPADWTVVELDVGAYHCASLVVAASMVSIQHVRNELVAADYIPPAIQRFARSAVGVSLGAGMMGLGNVFEPRKRDEAPIVVNHDGGDDGDRDRLKIEFDPENPKASKITIRNWKR